MNVVLMLKHVYHFQPEYLVIGGGGFLGRHLCEHLLQRGYSVRAFDIRKTFDNDKITFFVGDLCNEKVCAFLSATSKSLCMSIGKKKKFCVHYHCF